MLDRAKLVAAGLTVGGSLALLTAGSISSDAAAQVAGLPHASLSRPAVFVSAQAGQMSISARRPGKIHAHLTKTTFAPGQASAVELVYRFSPASTRFGYRLTFKKGSKWVQIKSVERTGSFSGSHKITVKKLFAGKPVKVGRYQLELSADGGRELLSFKVVKAKSGGSTPTGSAPTSTALPTISGTATQGRTLSSSNGSWSNSPTSYTRQWRRCNSSGASCSDIVGATSSSYTLVSADVGSTIRVVVTATNSHGSTSATSSQTAVVVTARYDHPSTTVKLIFIHHSTGEHWLADDNGELGLALKNNNYFVSDTNYGWGPDAIGDRTDIGHWWSWFRGENSSTYTNALYNEFGQNASYSRLATDPDSSRENEVIMFKSCFPNSQISGNPSDTPTTGSNPLRGQDAGSEYMTVANVKGIYNDILTYFAAHQDKLFILVTSPPLMDTATDAAHAANARAIANWLVNTWLADYHHNNVAVFDFYNVLTSNDGDANTNDLGKTSGNHHRWWGDVVQHIQTVASNYSAYPTDDSHPSRAGNLKATGEFIDLLNYYYHRWADGAE